MRMTTALTATALFAWAFNVQATARETDILKPRFQKQEQDFRRLMDKWIADGMEYEIKMEESTRDHWRWGQTLTNFNHSVSLPLEIEQELRRYDRSAMAGFVRKHIDTPQYSFPVAVLNVAFKTSGFLTMDSPFEAIVNKNRGEWSEKETEKMFAQEYVQGRKGYEQDIFSCSIPIVHANDIPAPDSLLLANRNTIDKDTRLAKDIASEISKGQSSMAFTKFPMTGENLSKWLHLCLHDERSKLPNNRFGFIKWCRENKPATKPYLLAVAMALFTVDGYDFNDENGTYTMNERGKMLMDFIAEFPIPENATRVQAVMGGGNKDEIEGMMKKHGTEEKWKELLKNPAHPAFAKYPQD